MKKIQILDYGSGNLFSISDALSRASDRVRAFVDSTFHADTDALILPGVGSFSSAQRILNENRKEILEAVTRKKTPLFGICLGMQLMFEESEEGPGEGLGIFRGKVRRFASSLGTKVPHMGWNTITVSDGPRTTICESLADSEWVYYVHSYFAEPEERAIVRAWTQYGNKRFPALISSGNVFGSQFHPEKSHSAGSKIISNLVRIVLNGDTSS